MSGVGAVLLAVAVFLVVLLDWGIWKLTVRLGWPGLVACAALGFLTHLGGQEHHPEDFGAAGLYAGLPLAVALLCGWRLATTEPDNSRWPRTALLAMYAWWLFVALAAPAATGQAVAEALGQATGPLLIVGIFEARLRHRERREREPPA